MWSGRTILALALLFGMVSCGPIPKPFKAAPGEKDSNTLLAIPDGAGITVAPVVGAEPALAGPLTEALVAELQKLDIPASSGAALTNGLLMEGVARWRDGVAQVDWTLTNPAGAEVASVSSAQKASHDDFATGDQDLIASLAQRSALLAATGLRPDSALTIEKSKPQAVAIVGVDGAPGDGNTALTRAMRSVLTDAGIQIAKNDVNAGLLLAGSVELEPIDQTSERVFINWWLMDDTGTVLGTLDQENVIPAGSLSERWGGAAYDAALANVDAIREILTNIDTLREHQRQAGG